MDNDVTKLTKLWIERFVIGLRLCPFAHFSFYENTIYYEVTSNENHHHCLVDLQKMITKMDAMDEKELSNSFLIFSGKVSFEFLLELKQSIDEVLEEAGKWQVVVFHPEFQFAGEAYHAAGNFINRSPYGMLHILRVEEVARAIEATPNVDEIPFENKKLLEDIQIKSISEIFEGDFVEKIKPYI